MGNAPQWTEGGDGQGLTSGGRADPPADPATPPIVDNIPLPPDCRRNDYIHHSCSDSRPRLLCDDEGERAQTR
jgi:hypothetical protein